MLRIRGGGGGGCWWIFSCFYKCSVKFKSGDWSGNSNTFIFFLLNQLWVSFAVCFGLLSCWRGPPASHPHCPGGWQQIHLKNIPMYSSIHVSFDNLDSAGTMRRRNSPYTIMLPSLNSIVGMGLTGSCRTISPPNMARSIIAKNFNWCLVHTTLLQMLCRKLQTSLNVSSVPEWSALPASSRSFWSPSLMVLGSRATLLYLLPSQQSCEELLCLAGWQWSDASSTCG